AFKQELAKSLALANDVRDASDERRAQRVVEYHTSLASAAESELEYERALEVTMRTVGKGAIEVPMQRVIAPETVQTTWSDAALDRRAKRARKLYGVPGKSLVLDDASLALVKRLYDASPASAHQRGAMIERLDRSLLADTALDQLELRPQISSE